jgi:transcriptional regulator with XRE-family HTH domain
MKLSDFMELKRLNDAEFARQLGRSTAAVWHYRKGSRIPRPDTMARIVALTNGAVTANDFFKRENAA